MESAPERSGVSAIMARPPAPAKAGVHCLFFERGQTSFPQQACGCRACLDAASSTTLAATFVPLAAMPPLQ